MSQQNPKAIYAMLDQAYSKLQEQDFESAVMAFDACLLVSPEEPAALRGRAISQFQLKKWVLAEADFKRAQTLEPQEPENSIGHAMSLAMQLKIYPAISELEVVLAKWPQLVRAHIQLGLLQFKIGAISKGKQYFEAAVQLHPTPEERRFLESTLKEQKTLDSNRYYRPDFHAMNTKRD